MENFDANAGTNKLANVLSDRMRRENDTSLCLDFGEIQGNGSLITNTFPVAIPKGQYSVCRHVGGLSFTTSGGKHGGHSSGDGSHGHTITPPQIKPGDRVLVAWVMNEACVIDVVTGSYTSGISLSTSGRESVAISRDKKRLAISIAAGAIRNQFYQSATPIPCLNVVINLEDNTTETFGEPFTFYNRLNFLDSLP